MMNESVVVSDVTVLDAEIIDDKSEEMLEVVWEKRQGMLVSWT